MRTISAKLDIVLKRQRFVETTRNGLLSPIAPLKSLTMVMSGVAPTEPRMSHHAVSKLGALADSAIQHGRFLARRAGCT